MSGFSQIHRVQESGASCSCIFSLGEADAKAKTYSDLVRGYIERKRKELIAKGDNSPIDLRFLDATGRNLNLSGVNLSHCDFTGANLTGAVLSGCLTNNTNFTNATLTECKMHAMRGKKTQFNNATLFKCHLAGAIFEESSFVEAKLNGCETDSSVEFRSCNFNLCRFNYCDMKGVTFSDPNMLFTRMTYCNLGGTKFLSPALCIDGANTYQGKKIKKDIDKYLPDRASKMRLIGCKYDSKTQIDACYKGIKYDRVADQYLSLAGLTLAVTGFEYAIDQAKELKEHVFSPLKTAVIGAIAPHMPHMPDFASYLPHFTDNHFLTTAAVSTIAVAFVGVGTAVLKHVITEKSVDWMREALAEASGFLKKSVMWTTNSASRLKDAALLLGDQKQIRMVYHALEKTSLGKQPGVIKAALRIMKHSMSGSDEASAMVVCDRKHFARALNYLSVRRPAKDINLIMSPNITGYSKKSPSVLNLNADGTSEAFWYSNDLEADRMMPRAIVRYDKHGAPLLKESFIVTAKTPSTPKEIREGDIQGRHPTPSDLDALYAKNMETVMASFRQRIIYSHQLDGTHFSYNPNTHYVEEGKKHSIIVRRLRKGEIDNPDGVAILPLKGEGFFLRKNREGLFLRKNRVLMAEDSELIEKSKAKSKVVRYSQQRSLSKDTVDPHHATRIEPKLDAPSKTRPEKQARASDTSPAFGM